MMVAAMAIFACADAFIRLASLTGDGATSGQFIVLQGIAGTVMFAWLMRRQGGSITFEMLKDRNIQYRTFGDLLAAAAVVTSLTLLPVGIVSAILQIQPLMVTIAAVFVLKEKVGINRWSAIIVGLIGGLIIMRPGMEGFDNASLLVLLGVLGLTIRDIYTRKLDNRFPTTPAVLIVSIALVPIGFLLHIMLAAGRPITQIELLPFAYMSVSAICAMIAYYILVIAMRIGEISAIAPYRYSRLIAAFLIAWLLLGETPDLPTIIGSLIVVAAGIAVVLRERQLKRRARN